MEIKKKTIYYKKKTIPARIHEGKNPKYLFVTLHGLLSSKNSFKNFENWIKEDAIVVNYDSRVHGENKMRPSRLASTYVRDLRDVIRWAKKEYPGIPVVTIGSSFGASTLISYAKKYGTKEVYKNVAWSVPYNFISAEESKEVQNKSKNTINKNKKLEIKEPTKWRWSWKFAIMIITNLNIKEYAKIDLERTADNNLLARLDKINKPKPTPIKLFYAAGKLIWTSNIKLKIINKRENDNFLYFQSTKDSYLKESSLKKLKKWTGKGVRTIYLNEGMHAFQWEIKNKLNEKIFQNILDWLEEKKR